MSQGNAVVTTQQAKAETSRKENVDPVGMQCIRKRYWKKTFREALPAAHDLMAKIHKTNYSIYIKNGEGMDMENKWIPFNLR